MAGLRYCPQTLYSKTSRGRQQFPFDVSSKRAFNLAISILQGRFQIYAERLISYLDGQGCQEGVLGVLCKHRLVDSRTMRPFDDFHS